MGAQRKNLWEQFIKYRPQVGRKRGGEGERERDRKSALAVLAENLDAAIEKMWQKWEVKILIFHEGSSLKMLLIHPFQPWWDSI